jgi:hypothetical protein
VAMQPRLVVLQWGSVTLAGECWRLYLLHTVFWQ